MIALIVHASTSFIFLCMAIALLLFISQRPAVNQPAPVAERAGMFWAVIRGVLWVTVIFFILAVFLKEAHR